MLCHPSCGKITVKILQALSKSYLVLCETEQSNLFAGAEAAQQPRKAFQGFEVLLLGHDR